MRKQPPRVLPLWGRLGILPLCVVLLAAGPMSAADAPRLNLVGSAAIVDGRVRLTPALRDKAGAAWWPEKKPITGGFQAAFQFQITETGGMEHGADGFAFVLQNSGPSAIAGRGAAGGFALGDGYGNPERPGIPQSLAVFFDTYKNPDGNDPSGNYIGVFNNGGLKEMHWPPPRLGFTKKLPIHLKDGKLHSARIQYTPPLLKVSLDDGEPVLSVPVDLTPVMDSAGNSYVGFTASTGDGYENHDILGWSIVSSNVATVQSSIQFLHVDCMEGRNLCTPKEAVVEERGAGKYHVILPAHIEWAASIPNPGGQPVTVSGAEGHVCWDLNTGGQAGCSGPEGALIQKTEGGRTWFSVSGPKHGDFAANQGFFEFDAGVQ